MKNYILILTLLIGSTFSHAETNNPQFVLKRGDASHIVINLNLGETSEVTCTLIEERQKAFGVFTKEHVGKKIDLVIEGKIVSSPIVRAVITGPTLQIASTSAPEAVKIAESLIPEKK